MVESIILKKFGRYFLLSRVAHGGMADIYLARMFSPETEGRLIVIKQIQSIYNSHKEFLRMFQSEIKLAEALTHPN